MLNDWRTVRLADLCDSIDYGLTASASLIPEGPRFLRITDIVSGQLNWGTVPYVSVTDSHFVKFRLNDGDIVIARTGASTGASAYISSPPPAVFASYLVRLRIKSEVDPRFVSYALRSSYYWDFIHGVLGEKSAQPNASAKTLTQAFLPLPPLLEQRAIADVLGALDDKIELNRRMNQTLEEIARTIFTSWFVRFDPVRAKAEGRQPDGMDAETAALFPDSLVDSELGDIPDGWLAEQLGYLAVQINRGISPVYIENGGVLVLNQKCVRDHRVDVRKGRRHDETRRRVDGRLLRVGDILVNSTGVGTLGRVAPILSIDEPTIVDSHVTVVRVNEKRIPYEWLIFSLLHLEPVIQLLGEGSTGQTELSRTRLAQLVMAVPDVKVIECFRQTIRPILAQIELNEKSSVTLGLLRDELLPKLLSGEVKATVQDSDEGTAG